jgi:hypothetical protein
VLVPQAGAGAESAEGVWTGATALLHDPQMPIELTGRTRYGPMQALLDQRTSRVRQFSAVISGSGTVLELEVVPVSPERGAGGVVGEGDGWAAPPSETGRTRVKSVRELGKKIEAPVPTSGPEPGPAPATPSDPATQPKPSPQPGTSAPGTPPAP